MENNVERASAINVGNPAVQAVIDMLLKFLRDNPQLMDFVIKQVMMLVEKAIRDALNNLVKETN